MPGRPQENVGGDNSSRSVENALYSGADALHKAGGNQVNGKRAKRPPNLVAGTSTTGRGGYGMMHRQSVAYLATRLSWAKGKS